ncbi:hypothetical protein NUW54_g12463 [Trametes sanguinea]|uniref:Uncharacterized protein n=1 Tax=Trametes sanguinea TaxID=158606 RepID=A0ACC1MXY8_9APHY|nr:hypothetical protein NUW54_g12463 [Trametes sanguinea]
MGKFYESIPDFLITWLEKQEVFWVATAPLSPEGHVNISPKGIRGSFRVGSPNRVWYQDLTGSGAETIAHIRENGRITLCFNAFEGPPRIDMPRTPPRPALSTSVCIRDCRTAAAPAMHSCRTMSPPAMFRHYVRVNRSASSQTSEAGGLGPERGRLSDIAKHPHERRTRTKYLRSRRARWGSHQPKCARKAPDGRRLVIIDSCPADFSNPCRSLGVESGR